MSVYNHNKFNDKRKHKWSYINKFMIQLAAVFLITVILIGIRYIESRTKFKASDNIKKIIYTDLTNAAIDTIKNGFSGTGSLVDIFGKKTSFTIDFLPVQGKIIGNFGNRIDEKTKKEEYISGINIEAKENTEVKCVADGKVETVMNDEKFGIVIVINHNNGFKTIYGYLSEIKVNEGKDIKKGDIIALSGKTGKAANPNLYFELKKNNESVDPVGYIKASTN